MDPTKLKPESYAVAKWGSRFAAVGINPAHHAGLPEAMASENGLATNGRRFRIPTGGSALPNRGLLAPLSPHEEVTLRRVAIGIAKPADLPARDVERLKTLMLVEQNGDGLQLTPVGRERYLALPNSADISESDPPDELVSKMAELVAKGRR
jgi:hypothetical protein